MKRLFTLTLCAVLCLTVLSGCGTAPAETQPQATEAAETSVPTTAPAAETEAPGMLSLLDGSSWEVGQIGELSFAEFCSQKNLDPEAAGTLWEISGDMILLTAGGETGTFPIAETETGFTIQDGSADTSIEVTYNARENTLSYELDQGEVHTAMVMVPKK